MIVEMFIPLFILMIVLTMYSFLRVDVENYSHIVSGFTGGILSLLLGFEVFDGIELYGDSSLLTTFDSGWVGLFLCVFGGIVVLYSVLQIINIISSIA